MVMDKVLPNPPIFFNSTEKDDQMTWLVANNLFNVVSHTTFSTGTKNNNSSSLIVAEKSSLQIRRLNSAQSRDQHHSQGLDRDEQLYSGLRSWNQISVAPTGNISVHKLAYIANNLLVNLNLHCVRWSFWSDGSSITYHQWISVL